MREGRNNHSLRHGQLLLTAGPALLLQSCCFLVPLAMTIALTFQGVEHYQLVWTWSLDNWGEIFSNLYYWRVLFRTILMATATVAICLFISVPVAYCVVNRLASFGAHFKAFIIFIFVTDAVLKTYGWVLFLDEKGVLNLALSWLGFGEAATRFLYTPVGTLVGLVYNLLPFMIFTTYLSMSGINRDLVHAAYDAGASATRTFCEVTLPLSKTGIWAGSVLVFVLSSGAFLEPKVLGGGTSPMIAEMIRLTFETRVNWPLGATVTVLLIVTTGLVVLLYSRLIMQDRREGHGDGFTT